MMAAGNQMPGAQAVIPGGKPPASGRKINKKGAAIPSELPDIQNRTLTNIKQPSGFSSARRKDSISELDLSSVKHTDAGDARRTGKRSSIPKTKFTGAGNTSNNLFPDIVNQQPAKRNNLMMDQTLKSNLSSHENKFGGQKARDNFDVQSIRSSEAGAFDQNQSIYSRESKNYNPFYHPKGGVTGMSGLQRSELSIADLQKKGREERRKLNEQKEQLIEDWGFQNEETKRMFEARFAKAKASKKKKTLTADEKYQRFLAIKRKNN